jgi:hypothetical protein
MVWQKDGDGNPIYVAPALATVTLNAKTATIGEGAFARQSALATVNNLNQGELATIGRSAFFGTALETVDLSAATKLTTIPELAFGETSKLKTAILSDKINTIEEAAFLHAKALTSINLETTKIKTLNNIFTNNWDDVDNAPAGLKAITLPDGLTTIMDYALQGLGIEEIVIPSSVTEFGYYRASYIEDGVTYYYTSYNNSARVLQGCVTLKKFTWKEALQNRLPQYTFRGCTNLEEVTFFTLDPIYTTTGGGTEGDGLTDNHFFMCSKEKLYVYVSAESYELLIGRGYNDDNSKYSNLVGDQVKEYAFSKNGQAADNYFYGTYYAENSSWFNPADVEVFTAVVERDKVVLKAAEVLNGYYKIPKYSSVILRSTKDKVTYEVKGLYNNERKNNSIYGMTNHLTYVTYDGEYKAGKLSYWYKLGVKEKVVAFYRITSGEFKKGQMVINAEWSKYDKKDRLDITIDGIEIDATAIFGVESATEDSNAPIYNMQGMRVKTAQKGLYIQDGKKFIKK